VYVVYPHIISGKS